MIKNCLFAFLKQIIAVGSICFISLVIIAACSKKNPDAPENPKPEITLQSAATFPFGAAVAPDLLRNRPAYLEVVTKEFNSITSENVLKMGKIHPELNRYDWTEGDYLVNYAQQNKKRLHGHTLIWHSSLPGWVNNFSGDSITWEVMFKNHIETVVKHYKGKIIAWDVVNEAFEDDGRKRQTVWLQHLGADYVARAFQYAHAADPDVLLFYNDFNLENSVRKRNAVKQMAVDFLSRGIPIHGIGSQSHISVNTKDTAIVNSINELAQTGLKVHISELDISANSANDPNAVFTAELAEKQKQKYKLLVQAYNSIPKKQQHGITTWNVGDADSWIRSFFKRKDWPLPFDDDYKKKPAYYGILEGLK